MSSSRRQIGYIELLRSNGDFRNLFTGQVISQIGDWLNSVALFTLLFDLTGSSQAVAYILILRLLPLFFFGPLAGVVADRYSRKAIMIASDVLRGLLVLGFLLVRSPDQVWIIYALVAAQEALTAFFEPALMASIPNIVSIRGLISANALSSVSWSATLAIGAALGGIVTDVLGREAAFLIDSASFFLSAGFILAVRIPVRAADRPKRSSSLVEAIGVRDMIEGARYLRSNPRVLTLLGVKSGWGLGAGVLLLLTVFGRQVFVLGPNGGTSIGLLYAARGTGALLGPILARAVAGHSPRAMRSAISAAFFISAAFYLLFASAPNLLAAAIFVVGAHAGGSIQWVFSTTLLGMSVPDQFRGRVFALELALLTLSMSLSTYLTGLALDRYGLAPRSAAALLGLVFLAPGLAWVSIQPWMSRGDSQPAVGAPVDTGARL
jgi:predicted MFS family arabinose efflux permease